MDEFTYMLAPMEDFVDSSFRTICYKYGADLTFTELIRFESLAKNNKSALRRIQLYDTTPTMIQLMGKNENLLRQFLSSFEPTEGFQGFNLNLGCPSPHYVNNGLGSAMIKRIAKTQRLVEIIKDHGYKINVKLRLGLNQQEKERKVYLNLIERVAADFFIVHARHRKERYSQPADWSVFAACVATGKSIIANGDVQTHSDVEQLKQLGCQGVMIGRAAVLNPLIFAQLKGMETPPLAIVKEEYDLLCRQRVQQYSTALDYSVTTLAYIGSHKNFDHYRK